jgi:DNA modification methylase
MAASACAPAGSVLAADCLDVLRDLPAGTVDLCYADPPFNTGRLISARAGAYDDRWNDLSTYLEFMRPRLCEVARVLKSTGSLLLHCDWRTCHHLRLMLDEIFGADRFVNHLIWRYGLGGSSPRRFARKHDDILFYAKSAGYYFDPPRIPATSNRMRGRTKKATDVIDIPSINNMADERAGYPTQKPLALLEMLVQACCPRDGLVLDPFCGSGTTLVAAARLGRQWIGIDRNPRGVRMARKRLGIH